MCSIRFVGVRRIVGILSTFVGLSFLVLFYNFLNWGGEGVSFIFCRIVKWKVENV